MYEYELFHHGVKGMKWGHRKRIQDSYADWKARRQQTAKDTMIKYGGNKKKAIAVTAAKSLGTAAAVRVGGAVTARLLGGTMNRSLAQVGAAINAGSGIASTVIAANGGVKIYDLAVRDKK